MAKLLLVSLHLVLCFSLVHTAPELEQERRADLIDLGYSKHIPTYINQTASGRRVRIYKNIRFARPPTGHLRFRKPNTCLPKVEGIQDGRVPWGSTNCISTAPSQAPYPGINGTTWGHEDCLFLDVYVPQDVNPGDKVSVIHFFFGSAYVFSSKDILFSPMGLFDFSGDAGKFIFVVNNYRLGMPGWTSVPGLDMDVNVGLHDCLAAARWTSKYIGRFGGDPDRVTAIGQSAGAGMIMLMTTLHGGEGSLPFQQAFISSPDVPPRNNTTVRRQQLFQAVLNATNCTDLGCLREVPEDVLLKGNDILVNSVGSGGGGVFGPSLGFGLVPDGSDIPDMPEALFRQGRYHKELRSLIIGTMANEGMGLSSDYGMPERFPELVHTDLPTAGNATVERIQELYTSLAVPEQLAWDWTTDAIFACNAYNLARAYPGRALRYIMSIPPAVHAQDLFYYFFVDSTTTPVADAQLAKDFQSRLLKFVHGEQINWPVYSNEDILFNITSNGFETTGLPADLKHRCNVINEAVLDSRNNA